MKNQELHDKQNKSFYNEVSISHRDVAYGGVLTFLWRGIYDSKK